MRVNTGKTSMICVSDSLSFEAEAFIYDEDDNRIGCQDGLKALGMVFGKRPTMDLHVEQVKKKMRQRYWILRNLKMSGFSNEELVKVYSTMIRLVADYGCLCIIPVSLTSRMSCWTHYKTGPSDGPGILGRWMREMSGLTHQERRIQLCDKFVAKCLGSDRFDHWFPQKSTRRSGRKIAGRTEDFVEMKARCNRLHNSPLFFFRQRLNGKPGKIYGLRNAEYRQ